MGWRSWISSETKSTIGASSTVSTKPSSRTSRALRCRSDVQARATISPMCPFVWTPNGMGWIGIAPYHAQRLQRVFAQVFLSLMQPLLLLRPPRIGQAREPSRCRTTVAGSAVPAHLWNVEPQRRESAVRNSSVSAENIEGLSRPWRPRRRPDKWPSWEQLAWHKDICALKQGPCHLWKTHSFSRENFGPRPRVFWTLELAASRLNSQSQSN